MKKVEKKVRSGLRTFDREVIQMQKRELGRIGKQIIGAPKIVQEEAVQPAGAVDRQAVRPLAALGTQGDNQEEATRDLYRRRRARGVATSPMGLTGQASVQRKTLLGS